MCADYYETLLFLVVTWHFRNSRLSRSGRSRSHRRGGEFSKVKLPFFYCPARENVDSAHCRVTPRHRDRLHFGRVSRRRTDFRRAAACSRWTEYLRIFVRGTTHPHTLRSLSAVTVCTREAELRVIRAIRRTAVGR